MIDDDYVRPSRATHRRAPVREIMDDEIPLTDVIDSVRSPEAGGMVIFMGTVRRDPGIEGLEMEAYEDMANQNMEAIRVEALRRFGVLDASIVHRVGQMDIGDDIVVIAVSAAHRAEAFEACRFLIDELKVTVPIWKKELGPGTWVKGEAPRDPVYQRTKGMVDVSGKEVVARSAVAEGFIDLTPEAVQAIRTRQVRKGDVLEVARVASLWGVKQTPNVIPHCHPIPVTAAEMDAQVMDEGVKVTCRVKADYRTGVEMEALTGVTVALLTIWDMVKYIEKDDEGQYPATRIHDVRVLEKVKEGPGGDDRGS
jgi:cyclic pyranopterin phosphate synthase